MLTASSPSLATDASVSPIRSLIARRRPRVLGMATAAVICVVYVIVRPPSVDFASGSFRAGLASRGTFLWNNLWFGGHSLPGYGILPPVLGATIGVVPVAVASVLIATTCFVLMIERWHADGSLMFDPTVGVVLFACCSGFNLFAGRLTFGPAIAFGTATMLAVQRDRRLLAALSAAACGLSSPVGALSLGLVLAAFWIARGAERSTLVIAAASALVPIGVLTVAFPEGGWYPFTSGSLTLLALSLLVVAYCGRRIAVVRWLVALYGFTVIVSFIVRSPLGGNVARLGWLLAGPIAALTVQRHRRLLLPVIVAGCLIWNTAYIAMALGAPHKNAAPSYYEPLAQYLNRSPQVVRVEVVPTETFGQADVLALHTNGIARGWETQLDRELNPELYTGLLDETTYHHWLLRNSVSMVALPLDGIQSRSQDEAAVIRSHPAYLRLVWATSDWQVYQVLEPEPLADHGASVVRVEPESLVVDAPQTGWVLIKYRYTELYRVESGNACLLPSADGWIRMLVRQPGRITLTISASLDAILHRPTACTLTESSQSS